MKSGLVSCCSYRLLWHHILLAWDCNKSGGQEKTNSHHCHIQLLLKCLATLHNFRNYKIITGENSNQNCKIVNVCLWKISSNISWYLRISSMLFQPGSCWWNHKKSSRRKKKKKMIYKQQQKQQQRCLQILYRFMEKFSTTCSPYFFTIFWCLHTIQGLQCLCHLQLLLS